jgi:hypothetical protein
MVRIRYEYGIVLLVFANPGPSIVLYEQKTNKGYLP